MQRWYRDVEYFLKTCGFDLLHHIPQRSIDERTHMRIASHESDSRRGGYRHGLIRLRTDVGGMQAQSANSCRGHRDRPSLPGQRVEVTLTLGLRSDHRKHFFLE